MHLVFDEGTRTMAKPNYSYQKRQRELEKKQKREAKRQKQQGADQRAADDRLAPSPKAPGEPEASTDG